jgi:hypothetical protein
MCQGGHLRLAVAATADTGGTTSSSSSGGGGVMVAPSAGNAAAVEPAAKWQPEPAVAEWPGQSWVVLRASALTGCSSSSSDGREYYSSTSSRPGRRVGSTAAVHTIDAAACLGCCRG